MPWPFNEEQAGAGDVHEDECGCPECDPDGNDPRNIDQSIAYEDDPAFEDDGIEFEADPNFFGPEDSDG